MSIIIDGEIIAWTTRITLKSSVKDGVRDTAHQEVRSSAIMIGILLEEALIARRKST